MAYCTMRKLLRAVMLFAMLAVLLLNYLSMLFRVDVSGGLLAAL